MKSDSLAHALPNATTFSIKQIPDCIGLTYVKGERDARFVTPDLEELKEIVPGDSSVVLVEAPAAVGKSMTAREVARITGGLLWNMAETQIGNYTFTGVLGTCFPAGDFAQIISGVESGEYVLILDALDEARLRSGDANFFAFLHDIARVCRKAGPRPGMVIFGRTDAIQYTTISLDGEGIPYSHLRISFFDKPAAIEMVEKRLDWLCEERGQTPLHRQQRQLFAFALGAVFKRIGDLLGGEDWRKPAVRSCLGYAPVLEGIAEYLFPLEGRYKEVVKELADMQIAARPTSVWEAFALILDGILLREHGKVKKLVKNRLAKAAANAGFSDWDSVFTPAEQRRRILAASGVQIQHGKLPTGIPPKVYEEYDQVAREQILEHPFLGEEKEIDLFAGVVFRDDTYSWLLAEPSVPTEIKGKLLARLQKDFRPSPILAQSLLARRAVEQNPPQLSGFEIGVVYESLYALSGKVRLELVESSAGELDGRFIGVGDEPLIFKVVARREELTFPLHLANTRIRVRGTVCLGRKGAPFYLGPTVWLECQALNVSGDLSVNTGDPGGEGLVTLIAEHCEHPVQGPRLEGKGEFRIEWSNVQPPWDVYATKAPPEIDDVKEFGEELMRALQVIARRNYAYLDLTREEVKKDFPPPVLAALRKAGILKERTKPIRGQAQSKPELSNDVKTALVAGVNDMAKGRLPDSVRELLRRNLNS